MGEYCKIDSSSSSFSIKMPNSDMMIKELLETSKVIAIVGLSPKEDRPSNAVAKYLKEKGYKIIPVNPGHEEILGEKSYPSLSAIPEKVDIVDIFRKSSEVLPIVEEAIKINPKCIWLQLGIVNEDAKKIAEESGILFIQDKCIKIEHSKFF